MTRCKQCRELIAFVRLKSGKSAPVESEDPAAYYLVLANTMSPPQRAIVTSDGTVLRGWAPVEGKAAPGVALVLGCEIHRCTPKPAVPF